MHTTKRVHITIFTSPAPRNAPDKINCTRSKKTSILRIGKIRIVSSVKSPLLSNIFIKLPEEKEIPTLIDSIYKEVSGSGLESNTFAPKGEVKKNIYAEIPIEMKVYGSYYDLANFFDRVSRLPRIVNIRDLNLSREQKKGRGDSTLLTADFTTVTFRLLPPGSTQPEADTKGKRGAEPKRSTKED